MSKKNTARFTRQRIRNIPLKARLCILLEVGGSTTPPPPPDWWRWHLTQTAGVFGRHPGWFRMIKDIISERFSTPQPHLSRLTILDPQWSLRVLKIHGPYLEGCIPVFFLSINIHDFMYISSGSGEIMYKIYMILYQKFEQYMKISSKLIGFTLRNWIMNHELSKFSRCARLRKQKLIKTDFWKFSCTKSCIFWKPLKKHCFFLRKSLIPTVLILLQVL